MPAIEMERVPENGSDCGTRDSISDSENVVKKKKIRKRGIIYLSTIPPYMNVAKVREMFSQFGEVGRIYLQPSGSKYFEVMLWFLKSNIRFYNLLNKCYNFFQNQEKNVSECLTNSQKDGWSLKRKKWPKKWH